MVERLDDFVAEVRVEAVLFAAVEGDDEDLGAAFEGEEGERWGVGVGHCCGVFEGSNSRGACQFLCVRYDRSCNIPVSCVVAAALGNIVVIPGFDIAGAVPEFIPRKIAPRRWYQLSIRNRSTRSGSDGR